MGTMPWYVEKWYEEDLKTALKEAGVPVTERRIARLRDACTGIFDDLSSRMEMLKEKAEELFEIEVTATKECQIKYNCWTENLMEIVMVYEQIKGESEYLFEKLTGEPCCNWKAKFVEWANEFELVYIEDGTYPEKIKKFARRKILEYVEVEEPDEKES